MTPESLEHLRRTAGQALDRYARTRAETERRGDEPPRPGEIFAFAETAGRGVLWAVLDRDPDDAGRFLLVAADLNPLVGSRDVAVPADALCGAMSLRCAVALWLPAPSLAAAKRTGLLEPEILAQARSKCAGAGGSALEQEVEAVPEYQDWIAEVEEARRTLAVKFSPRSDELPSAKILAFPSPARGGFFRNVYALAASVLLVVTLGLATGMGWQYRQLQREGTAAPVVNLPFAYFPALGAVRGEAKIVTVAPAANFLLMLEVSQTFPVYRLEIRNRDSGALVWESSELTRTGGRELTVLLPRRWFPDGEYRLRVQGLDDGGAVVLEENYLLRLESP